LTDKNAYGREEDVMVVDLAKIERLEKELEEARRELLKEDGERYRILMRDISKDERERILGGLRTRESGSFSALKRRRRGRGEWQCAPAEQAGI
jgi:hypothetical protein